MNWAVIIWLVLLILFLIVEAACAVHLVCLWFAVGALAALIASLLQAQLWVQITVFLAVSCVLLALLRPLVRKFLNPRIVKTNVDSIIGTVGKVTQTIDNLASAGQVKLGAMEWTARSHSGDVIPEGTLVRVERIEGVKVFVVPAEVSAEVK